MLLLLYCLPLLLKVVRGVVHVIAVILSYHYCLRYDRGVVHVVVVILSTITL